MNIQHYKNVYKNIVHWNNMLKSMAKYVKTQQQNLKRNVCVFSEIEINTATL